MKLGAEILPSGTSLGTPSITGTYQENFLLKATHARQGDNCFFPTTQKQIQRLKQNEETEEYVPR